MKVDREQAESIVTIDENNLDKECNRLSSDYLKWAFALADARAEIAQAQADLELAESEAAKKIRANPEKFGAEKVTEALVKEKIPTSARVQEAVKTLMEARHNADLFQATVSALEHKRRMLEQAVSLYGMSYHSDVKMDRSGKEAVEEIARKGVRKTLKRGVKGTFTPSADEDGE